MRNAPILAVVLYVAASASVCSVAYAQQQDPKDNPWVDITPKAKVFVESTPKGTWVKPSGLIDVKARNNPRYFVTGQDMAFVQAIANKENGHIILGIKSEKDNRGLQFLNMENCDVVVIVPVDGGVAEFPVTEADELVPCNTGLVKVVIRNPKGLAEKVGKKK
jgi:hypothetical protein